MNEWRKLFDTTGDSGQSLLEVALFMPILIFVLAGIVEVTNLLNTQNRVTTASRVGAGFGASNFEHDDWAGTAAAMGQVTRNTVTETLDIDPDLWDIWSIHATTGVTGTIDFFTHTHVFGNNSVVAAGDWSGMATTIEQDVEDALKSGCVGDPSACAANLEVVASVPFHNIDTILGLPLWQWTGLSRIRGLTVMRVGQFEAGEFRTTNYEPESNNGCAILPITLHIEQYSMYPTNWPPGVINPANNGQWISDTVSLFPGDFSSQMAAPTPFYRNTVPPTDLITEANFEETNTPGVPLRSASEGDIFFARDGFGPGDFGWLTWRGNPSKTVLDHSLTWPGDFTDLTTGYPGSPADLNTVGNGTYGDTGDGNGELIPGEWVEGTTGNINVARNQMETYMTEPRINPTILVHGRSNDLTGSNLNYEVFNFATVKILGYKFQGSEKWIVFEFIKWGVECD